MKMLGSLVVMMELAFMCVIDIPGSFGRSLIPIDCWRLTIPF